MRTVVETETPETLWLKIIVIPDESIVFPSFALNSSSDLYVNPVQQENMNEDLIILFYTPKKTSVILHSLSVWDHFGPTNRRILTRKKLLQNQFVLQKSLMGVIPFLCHTFCMQFLFISFQMQVLIMYFKYPFLQSNRSDPPLTSWLSQVIPHPGLIVYFVSLLMVWNRGCSLLTTLLDIVRLSIALVAAFVMMVRVSVTILLVPVSCISSCKLASVCCM